MTEKDEREKESEEIEKAKGPILPAARVSMISFISGAAYGITSVFFFFTFFEKENV